MMAEEKTKDKCKKMWKGNSGGTGEAIYGVGLIGALVYFIQHAESFGAGVLGVFKALVWPAYLVYYLLQYLKM
jgi:hypothetical protein